MTGPNRSAWALDHQALIRYLIGLLLMFTKTPSPLAGEGWGGGLFFNGLDSHGKTAGAALDALATQLAENEGPLIIVQSLRPDRWFNADQQQRLADLMDRWRLTRDRGTSLSTDEQRELETLVEMELQAATCRAATLAVELES